VSYSSEVLADSPLAWWKLDEASGTSFADSSGNSRAAAITGSPTFGVASLASGLPGTATVFGSGVSAVTANGSWMNSLSALSVEMWFKTTNTSSMIAISRDNTATVRQFHARLNGGNMEWDVWSSGAVLTSQFSPAAYANGVAHHCMMTLSATAQKNYVDGAQVVTGATEPVQLGNFSGGTLQYLGTLQSPAIYATELSAARVLAHYNAGIATAPVVPPVLQLGRTALMRAATR
jgi:hypothetical protein